MQQPNSYGSSRHQSLLNEGTASSSVTPPHRTLLNRSCSGISLRKKPAFAKCRRPAASFFQGTRVSQSEIDAFKVRVSAISSSYSVHFLRVWAIILCPPTSFSSSSAIYSRTASYENSTSFLGRGRDGGRHLNTLFWLKNAAQEKRMMLDRVGENNKRKRFFGSRQFSSLDSCALSTK